MRVMRPPSAERSLPPLPVRNVGAPPGRPPGVSRPAPRMGGLGGLAVPPEIRRRVAGAKRAAPGAAQAAERLRLALRKPQRKLLDARQQLRWNLAAVRAQLVARK